MRKLALPDAFPLPGMIADVADDDAMHQEHDERYLTVGLSALRVIESAVSDMPPPRRILDLPSGHGRVTRVLRARFPEAAITVCDIDKSAVAFASEHFNARGVHSLDDFRELQLDDTFDLIWVGSLITHFAELQTRRFLDCMVRHMTPSSTLVVSAHGALVAERIERMPYGLDAPAVWQLLAEYQATGYGYQDYPGGKGYGISLISREWFEGALAGSPLSLIRHREAQWDDHHDILMLRLANASEPRRGLARLLAQGWRGASAASNTGWFEAHYSEGSIGKPAPGFRDFDETWYVGANPDVAAAIQRGEFGSGLEHYLRYGRREGRFPWPPDNR